MRSAFVAIAGGAAALAAASMLGVASAEAPPTTPARTVSVEGVAKVAIGQRDNAAEADAVYREAMAAAVADGQGKAEFLLSKVGGTLGEPQSVTEGGGDIGCVSEGEGSEEGYVGYLGEQPDFGSNEGGGVAPLEAAATSPKGVKHAKKRKRRRPTAVKASTVVSCTLSARVALVYLIA